MVFPVSVSNRARCCLGPAVAAPLLVALLAGCSSSPKPSPTTTTIPPPTTTTAPTTTTVAIPPAPGASPDAVSNAFIADWKKHDQAAAATIATPAAITALFSTPYTGQTATARGCSLEFLPRVCSFGNFGGGPSTGPLYQIDVLPTGTRWYVSAAMVET